MKHGRWTCWFRATRWIWRFFPHTFDTHDTWILVCPKCGVER